MKPEDAYPLRRQQDWAPVQVIGMGLGGLDGLTHAAIARLERATLAIGSARHLAHLQKYPPECLPLGDLDAAAIAIARHLIEDPLGTEADDSALLHHVRNSEIPPKVRPDRLVAILASGDPLLFGIGRFLQSALPTDWLEFHPSVSSIQLAFARLKRPWQDATTISAHGRSPDRLIRALRRGDRSIAVLTDAICNPVAIARLVLSLNLPANYHLWTCENLGSPEERVRQWSLSDNLPDTLDRADFAPLNIVILERVAEPARWDRLPVFGIRDRAFAHFADRPGLMTKREIRVLALAELDLPATGVVWDIGAGTGSVSVEMARLCPELQVYAIETTAAGARAIAENCQRFGTQNVTVLRTRAPEGLTTLPAPDRVFIGGTGGNLGSILEACAEHLVPGGRIVLALATLENLAAVLDWRSCQTGWHYTLLQANLSRSVAIGDRQRLEPLNPVYLTTLTPSG